MKVTSKEELRKIIQNSAIDTDLNYLDVSEITDMSYMFLNSRFNGDISGWDVSNVKDMQGTFSHSLFNGDISKWNVSNVTDMSGMFCRSKFNGDISKWDVSNVTDMSEMFSDSQFNGDISGWNVSNVRNMSLMFYKSQFNQDISGWDISTDANTSDMFELNLKHPTEGVKENIALDKFLAETEKTIAQILDVIVQFTETLKTAQARYAEQHAKTEEQTKRLEALLDNYEKRSIGNFIDVAFTSMSKDTNISPGVKE